MIKIFKWWWAWNYEKLEEWLEDMEAVGLRLVKTRFDGSCFYFEKCTPAKARYCIDYQTRLTPEYYAIINDDGWKMFKIGFGWYILRKEYQQERPELYNNFDGLIARNKTLLKLLALLVAIEIFSLSNLLRDAFRIHDESRIAFTCIFSSLIIAFFAFVITQLALQINRFGRKHQ